MWDLIVSAPDHCLSFYFSNFSCFISFGNKRSKVDILTLRLWKKLTWGLTYFTQFICPDTALRPSFKTNATIFRKCP